MILNGVEYGFYYSVWAHCEYSDWLVSHQEVSIARATVQKAIIMNEAYRKLNGGPQLKPEDIINLPAREYTALEAELTRQQAEDTEVTVEAEAPKGKNGRSPGK